ncbi:MAG: hypothetical protein KA536_22230 [Saprospiraceae bacterium]|nr:hypothetical protein [Saprospiraceae bacterium]
MNRLSVTLIFFIFFSSCEKTSKEEGEDKYKNQFLKLAEFDCDGITSDYYVIATIDNIEYCRSVNDTIQNVLRLFNNFTTSTPNSTDTISGSAYNTIWFGIFKDFDLSKTVKKQFFFISGEYSDKATAQDIASDIFIKGRVWPIRNSTNDKKAISCVYQFSDNREGHNTYYEVNSKYGNSKNCFLIIENVEIERHDNVVIYFVELSFEADLYMSGYITDHRNLWGELRNGKMKAKFVVPL